MSHTSTKAKTTTKVPGPFVVEVTFAQIKPAKTNLSLLAVLGQMILDEVADGSGVVDVDGSGRKAGVEGLACQGLVAGKGQRVAIDQVERALAAQTVDTGTRDDDVVEALGLVASMITTSTRCNATATRARASRPPRACRRTPPSAWRR